MTDEEFSELQDAVRSADYAYGALTRAEEDIAELHREISRLQGVVMEYHDSWERAADAQLNAMQQMIVERDKAENLLREVIEMEDARAECRTNLVREMELADALALELEATSIMIADQLPGYRLWKERRT